MGGGQEEGWVKIMKIIGRERRKMTKNSTTSKRSANAENPKSGFL